MLHALSLILLALLALAALDGLAAVSRPVLVMLAKRTWRPTSASSPCVPATINGLPPGSAQRPRLLRSSER